MPLKIVLAKSQESHRVDTGVGAEGRNLSKPLITVRPIIPIIIAAGNHPSQKS